MLTAVDFSEGMLEKAKQNIKSTRVNFIQADITGPWDFSHANYDLITFSLVLEHVEDLNAIFEKASKLCHSGALLYVSELHPFKQYSGSKARFETENGLQVVTCYTHHVSEFTDAARVHGISVVEVKEYFDDDDRTTIPRLITFLFTKT